VVIKKNIIGILLQKSSGSHEAKGELLLNKDVIKGLSTCFATKQHSGWTRANLSFTTAVKIE
jgi:hypothetical protein